MRHKSMFQIYAQQIDIASQLNSIFELSIKM